MTKKYRGLTISEGYVERLEQRIVEMEQANEIWRGEYARMQAALQRLRRLNEQWLGFGDAEQRRIKQLREGLERIAGVPPEGVFGESLYWWCVDQANTALEEKV